MSPWSMPANTRGTGVVGLRTSMMKVHAAKTRTRSMTARTGFNSKRMEALCRPPREKCQRRSVEKFGEAVKDCKYLWGCMRHRSGVEGAGSSPVPHRRFIIIMADTCRCRTSRFSPRPLNQPRSNQFPGNRSENCGSSVRYWLVIDGTWRLLSNRGTASSLVMTSIVEPGIDKEQYSRSSSTER